MIAELGLEITSEGVAAATAELTRLEAAAGKVESRIATMVGGFDKIGKSAQASAAVFSSAFNVQPRISAMVGGLDRVAKSARESASAFQGFFKQRAAIESLEASINPAIAAAQRYAAAQQKVNAAVATGAITQQRANEVLVQAAKAYNFVETSSVGVGNRFRYLGSQIQMASYQIQDFSVQIAGGTAASLAFAQQFPQFSSIFGPGGAALGAFIAIAVGLVPVLMRIGDEAEDTTTALEDLTKSVDAYKESARIATMTSAELAKAFGTMGDEAKRAAEVQAKLDLRKALRDNRDAGEEIKETLKDVFDSLDALRGLETGAGFGVTKSSARDIRDAKAALDELLVSLNLSAEEAAGLRENINNLGGAVELNESVAAADQLLKYITDIYGGANNIPEALEPLVGILTASTQRAAELNGIQEEGVRLANQLSEGYIGAYQRYWASLQEVIDAQAKAFSDGYRLYDRTRQAAREAQLAADRVALSFYEMAQASRAASDASVASADDILAKLNEEIAISEAIARYGEESSKVTDLRADAERRAFEELLASLDVAESLKTELMDAFLAAQSLAATNIEAPITAAAGAAAVLAANLRAANLATTPAMLAEEVVMTQEPLPAAHQEAAVANLRKLAAEQAARDAKAAGGGGGGGGQSQAEKDHAERLKDVERIMKGVRTETEIYNDELAELNELYRLDYLSATQYAKALAYVNAEFAESKFEVFIQGVEDVSDAIASAIVQSDNLGEAFRRMLEQMAEDLISSGIQSLIMETFGDAIAGGAGGGFWKTFFSSFGAKSAKGNVFQNGQLTPFARGGVVNGPTVFPMRRGAGLMGEAGPEAVMPLRRDSHGNLGVSAGGGGGEVAVRVYVDQDGNWQSEVEKISGRVVASGLRQADRALPGKMAEFQRNPRVRK